MFHCLLQRISFKKSYIQCVIMEFDAEGKIFLIF